MFFFLYTSDLSLLYLLYEDATPEAITDGDFIIYSETSTEIEKE